MASERTNTINKRIYERNIPSKELQPYLDVRPTPTKYALFPIIDLRRPYNVGFPEYPTFNNEKEFNPGDKSPWSEYASNINIESELRNEYNRYEKCGINVYIPDSHSSLYEIKVPRKKEIIEPIKKFMPPKTFSVPNFDGNIFMNNTRLQR